MDKVEKSDAEWKESLSEEEFKVCRKKGTEAAFSGKYWINKEVGVYYCVCCKFKLFDSTSKFDSGTGWPSFWKPISADKIKQEFDQSLPFSRTEIICNNCGGHLGHVFNDGPNPTGLRYCVNSVSLDFDLNKNK